MFSVFDGRRQPLENIFFENVKMHKHKLPYAAFKFGVYASVKELKWFS